MPEAAVERPILAITYRDGSSAAAVLRRLWQALTTEGGTCAGVLQHNALPLDGAVCGDMILECLATGERLSISDDRGPMARGCRLDVGELMRALEIERKALDTKPNALFVNKFGTAEGEGGGLRPLMADAIDRGIPVLVTVPRTNIERWRQFAGDLALEVADDAWQPEGDVLLLRRLGVLPRVAGCSIPPSASSGADSRCDP